MDARRRGGNPPGYAAVRFEAEDLDTIGNVDRTLRRDRGRRKGRTDLV
jgi:hypothetical protein